jgi:4-alpha-glucanotransferase
LAEETFSPDFMTLARSAGILVPLHALPNGIADLKILIDWAADHHLRWIQLLPINDGEDASPYNAWSAFAANPRYLSLSEHEKPSRQDEAFQAYYRKNQDWLADYALFMALKDQFRCGWQKFPKPLRERQPDALTHWEKRLADPIIFYSFIQWKFDEQWADCRAHANQKNLFLLGDLSFYLNIDSDAVWADRTAFDLNGRTGVPPDFYAATGQFWEHYPYDWAALKKIGYRLWKRRVSRMLEWFDGIRIDHFRALFDYYKIPPQADTAQWKGKNLRDAWKKKHWLKQPLITGETLPFPESASAESIIRMLDGEWHDGPRDEFIREVFGAALSKKSALIVAEDLGLLSRGVYELRDRSGIPGMKPVIFGLDLSPEYWDAASFPENSVAVTTTHDCATLAGELGDLNPARFEKLAQALRNEKFLNEPASVETVRIALLKKVCASPSMLAVIAYQDLFGLDNTHRTNRPNTVGPHNWTDRFPLPVDDLKNNRGAVAQKTNALLDQLLTDSDRRA